jgi:hypothetical protein
MAGIIMAAQPLLRNDIPILAQLFEVSFDYFINHHSPLFTDYLQSLRAVVGLGFTAVLVHEGLLCCYEPYLKRFIAHDAGDFQANQGAKTLIAQSVSEMVNTATLCFEFIRYPRYYEDFIKALRYTIARIPERANEKSEAERILNYLKVDKW